MLPKKAFPTHFCCFYFFVSIAFFSQDVHSQCAGDDAVISICDISNPSNQNLNLFGLLNGTPTPGGIWNDPLQTGALDEATGILNVWSINLSGSYDFTYTVTGVDGCTDNTATITITIGGYSGIPSPGSVCSDDSNVNLFQFFTGAQPSPQLNGTWSDDDQTGALSENFLNAVSAGEGTYNFTYTMPAIGDCPATSSTTTVTVHRSPEPGTAENLELCSTDDLTLYTNLNLFDLLTEEDSNGTWTESGSSELASPFDSFINVENLYNTSGAGTYSFTYTVNPSHPICEIEEVTINIVLEDPLDLSNATLQINSDICEDEIASATYQGVLTDNTIPDGSYELTVEISGDGTGGFAVTSQFNGGILNFDIDPVYFNQVGQYNLTITNIIATEDSGLCETIGTASGVVNVFPNPDLSDATLAIEPICEGTAANVLMVSNNIPDGNYQITYSLSGNNTVTDLQANIIVANGNSNFTISAGLLPNPGETTLSITAITNVLTGCAGTAALTAIFIINETPDPADFSILVNDICLNEEATILVSGLDGLNNVDFSYSLSGSNSVANQLASVTLNGGNGSFAVPAASLSNSGNTTITISSIANTETSCGNSDVSVSFSFDINPIPEAPAASDATFCETDLATIADLLPNGNAFNWFISANDANPLPADTVLMSGNYFVSQTTNANGCTSERTMISVTINTVEAPTLVQDGENFCGVDNPTLQDLSANVNANETVVWFDAPSDGNELPDAELLVEGMTYYGFQFSDTVNCFSSEMLAVTVNLSDCDDNDDDVDFFIPDGFSPNGDSVNNTFRIPDIEFLYPDFALEIYNRYGNLMFRGNKNKPDWDGKNGDSNLVDGTAPNGVYFYILYFNKDNKSPKQGRLYLNR